jgi:hypothetical protein
MLASDEKQACPRAEEAPPMIGEKRAAMLHGMAGAESGHWARSLDAEIVQRWAVLVGAVGTFPPDPRP